PSTEPETESEPDTAPETESKTQPDTEPQTERETQPDTGSQTESETQPETETQPVQTGDDTPLGMYFCLLGLAAIVILSAVIYRWRGRKL
ncbi:MAG: hypothetical protein LUI07_05700, partial [Lachnospiraceae bacterium]|nr:hypothetical protein [Lachnospiraceae bacterium]